MGRRLTAALSITLLCFAIESSGQTSEERAVARELIVKNGDALVFLVGTTKLRVNQGGKETQNQDQRLQTQVTLLDSSGLGVMSLTAFDPSEVLSAQASRGRGAGGAVTVTTEASDLRYRLPDGREVPVRVVLRDKELDLAFLRPMEKPATPLRAIDSATAKPGPIDPVIALQRLPEMAGWQMTAFFYSVYAVVEKPRTFYLLTGGVVGSPIFDSRSRFVGIIVRLKNDADPANAPLIVMPANEIREVAKQAN